MNEDTESERLRVSLDACHAERHNDGKEISEWIAIANKHIEERNALRAEVAVLKEALREIEQCHRTGLGPASIAREALSKVTPT